MQAGLLLAASTLAAVLGMALLEEGVCKAPDGKNGSPGRPGRPGRPGQRGEPGEPGKRKPGMLGGLGAPQAVGAAREMCINSFSSLFLPRESRVEHEHQGTQRG